MNIAVIPARGGSKRIPRKNINSFCGRPMIAWAIELAKNAGLFEHIIVSTDDLEIAKISTNWGAEVPFLRPPSLADDFTPTVPVMSHAVRQCMRLGWNADYFCCIYPCTPLLKYDDLIRALDCIQKKDVDFVYPVTEFQHPIQRAMRMGKTGAMEFLTPENELKRTQDFEECFHDAGQFYWGKTDAWLENKRMHTGGLGMKIPSWRVVDIDTAADWHRAEVMKEVYDKLGSKSPGAESD